MRNLLILAAGLLLCLLGMALPFMMIVKLLEPTLLLCFAAFGSSVGGLALGLSGSSFLVEDYERREG